jgi:hypothetical protein
MASAPRHAPKKILVAQTTIDWRKEWFEIEDATYLNTAAHAVMPRVSLNAVQTSIEANRFPHRNRR